MQTEGQHMQECYSARHAGTIVLPKRQRNGGPLASDDTCTTTRVPPRRGPTEGSTLLMMTEDS